MLRSALAVIALTLPMLSLAQAVDELWLVSRPSGVGSNVNRAKVDKRALAPGRMKELMTPYIKSDAACAEFLANAQYTIEAASMPDRIGYTGTHLTGAGLYVGLPEAGVTTGRSTAYIAPYIALDLDVADASGKSRGVIELREFRRYELRNVDELGDAGFLKLDTPGLEAAVKAYADKAVPAAIERWAQEGCKLRQP
ncbi:MAG TPA: hypothetical protein VNU21_03370 [Usitatibacter sp.]|nr:hypothetical protein [Usitatibacter sp.]